MSESLEKLAERLKLARQTCRWAEVAHVEGALLAWNRRPAPKAEGVELLRKVVAETEGCSDGGCVIRKPVGMHTNGGCRCFRDPLKAQRIMRAVQLALATPAESDGRDGAMLDWLEARAFTVYRNRDPEDGSLSDHVTVVNEDAPGSRVGILGPTLRDAIRTAMQRKGG